ncbi:alpha/beta fold hydrolase [Amnibacterium setariae]|uniref:Alpha/beta fold hydrolase n=1 Tax=Amnibacterium setariae TaxID=2306585 RepID=A0A3A1U195_9MICO|nr:alpha/beta fold hydrolase [Amnibacterium setariae]RIX30644.1 alpha/beta fold hydrolase [Amnibacterium setariae]
MTSSPSSGFPVLVVHGGGGPATVAPLVAHLAARHRVLAPTIPGFDGTTRRDAIRSVDDVAAAFLDLLAEEGLERVAVVGSSVGGWVASAMAVQDAGRVGQVGRVGRVVLIDAVGVDVPDEPIRDVAGLDPRSLAPFSWHDPDRFLASLPAPTPESLQRFQGNQAALHALAGDPYMHDPGLLERLSTVRVPVLGIWGASDRVTTPAYGRAMTAAFPGSRFEAVAEAGHLPHLEQPERVLALLDAFLAEG